MSADLAVFSFGHFDAGPITRIEALEIPKLIDEVREGLREPKIGMLDPNIELHGYETVAELERALPAHLEALAKGMKSSEGSSELSRA